MESVLVNIKGETKERVLPVKNLKYRAETVNTFEFIFASSQIEAEEMFQRHNPNKKANIFLETVFI